MSFSGILVVETMNHLVEEFTSEKLVNRVHVYIVQNVSIHFLYLDTSKPFCIMIKSIIFQDCNNSGKEMSYKML